jgi:hypothetical protein
MELNKTNVHITGGPHVVEIFGDFVGIRQAQQGFIYLNEDVMGYGRFSGI